MAKRSRKSTERWSACYAPHSSMYFDQFGKVRACCQNTGVYLGDVSEQSLREVWESAEAEHMRSALEADDYSAGCEFCEWQVREGNEEILFARQFDVLQPSQKRPRWPRQMEFSLTNTCNLACAMCNGDWSSTIRAKREGRPPIPVVYGDAFYEQLAEFLPHLEEVAFLGGEPFLGKEPLRVMEMLAELDEPPNITITTNGTISTDRVRRVVSQLRPNIVISIDGASEATYDAIRIGAHFPEVLANLDWFRNELDTGMVSIAHCLMTSNWHEFADLLHLAEGRDLHVGVNVVRFPEEQSLYQLAPEQLDEVVSHLRATPIHLTGRRLQIWNGHLAALEHRLEVLRDQAHEVPGTPVEIPGSAVSLPRLDQAEIDAIRSDLAAAAGTDLLEVEMRAGQVRDVQIPAWSAWMGAEFWEGVAFEDLERTVERHVGGIVVPTSLPPAATSTERFSLSIKTDERVREVWATRLDGPDEGRTTLLLHPPIDGSDPEAPEESGAVEDRS